MAKSYDMNSVENPETVDESGEKMVRQKKRAPQRGRFGQFVVDNLFLLCNLIGIIVGFLVGLLFRSVDIGENGILWLGLPGEIYMRILKCIIIPLIVCSVIDGTANTDPRTNGKLGLVALSYILISNTIGATLGLVLSVAFKPGSGVDKTDTAGGVDTRSLTTVDIVADFIRNVFPPNLVGAALQVTQTKYTFSEKVSEVTVGGVLVNETSVVASKTLGTVSSTNILGLIVVSAALGIAASQSGEHGKPFLNFFKAGAHIIFKLFTWIKWTTPVGSASLIAASLAKLDNLGPAFRSMGVFSLLVVVVNIVLIQLIGQSIVFFVAHRINPFRVFLQSFRAWLMAFASINSAIPYPEYVRVVDYFGVDPRVIDYVLPLSVTLNRCGSASFITGASVFVTQYTGVGTDIGSTFTICFLGILSSLAVPAVNSSSVVAVVIILESMSVPTTGAIGLIMAMEWFNDRIRTTSNAMSHIACILVTWRLCKKSMERVPVGKTKELEEDQVSAL